MGKFSHYEEDGTSKMVDISKKEITRRSAWASGFVKMQKKTLDLIEARLLPKGNVFEVAKIAGIMAAKRTSGIIPMCHPLLLSFVDVQISIDRERTGISINSEIRLDGKTGAEMEALTAAAVAALTVYDMCKAVDKTMIIEDIRLLGKKGGRSDLASRK
jgi:cyclic pyranopterin phosphate synthase